MPWHSPLGAPWMATLLFLAPGAPASPAAPVDLPKDPVAVYTFEPETFDEAVPGGTASAPNLRDPLETSYGAVVAGATRARGVAGHGLRFASAGDAVTFSGPRRLRRATSVTVAAWISIDELRGANYVVSHEDWASGKTRGFVLRLTEAGEVELTIGHDGWHSCRGPRLAPGDWHHLLATADRATLALWVDGKRVATAPSEGALEPSPFGVAIGRGNYDRDRGFAGAIDEVAIYDRVLSPEEIDALHILGRAGVPLAKPRLLTSGAASIRVEADATKPKALLETEVNPELHTWGDGELVLVVPEISRPEDPHVSVHAGKDMSLRELTRVPLPRSAQYIAEAHSTVDPEGITHLFLYETSEDMERGKVHYAQVDPEGKQLLRWIPLTSRLGLESQLRFPVLLPLAKGRLALFAAGENDPGTFAVRTSAVTAEVSRGRVRPLRRRMIPSRAPTDPLEVLRLRFLEFRPYARVLAATTEDVWLVENGRTAMEWIDLATGKRTPWFSVGDFRTTQVDSRAPMVLTRGGWAYCATRISHRDGPVDDEDKIWLARSRPGTSVELAEIPGSFDKRLAYFLLTTSEEAVYFLGVTPPSEDGMVGAKLQLWDVTTGTPELVRTLCEAGLIAGLTVAIAGDETIHVVLRDAGATHLGFTTALRRRSGS